MKVRMGELLVRAGVISDAQLRTALKEQRQWGGRIGDILVRMQYVTEDVFVRALSKQTGIARADLDQPIAPAAIARIPGEVAEEYEVIPVELQDDGRTLVVATADPLNVTTLDHLGNVSRCRVVPRVAGASALRQAIARYYQGEDLRDAGSEMRILDSQGQPVPVGRGQPDVEAFDPRPLVMGPGPVLAPLRAPPAGTAAVGAPGLASPAAGMPAVALVGGPTLVPGGPLPGPAGLGGAAVPPSAMGGALPPGGMAALEPQAGLAPPAPYAVTPAYAYVPPTPSADQRLETVEEAQRRETAALRALVEMLVEQGVIRLEDYLSRLRR